MAVGMDGSGLRGYDGDGQVDLWAPRDVRKVPLDPLKAFVGWVVLYLVRFRGFLWLDSVPFRGAFLL